jgi:hypothetical protein
VKRRLFNLLALVSLVLCAATVVLWVRTYWWTDRIIYHRADCVRWLQSKRGEIVIQKGSGQHIADLRGSFSYPSPPNTIALRDWGGFWWCTMRNPKQILVVEIVLPFWSIVLATAALPLGRTITRVGVRIRALRRKSPGLCSACGYDLRAAPE